MDAATKEAILAKVKDSVEGELEVTERNRRITNWWFFGENGRRSLDATVANQFNNLKQRLTR